MAKDTYDPDAKAIQILEDEKVKLKQKYERELREINGTIERIKSNSARRVPGRMQGMSIPGAIHAFLLSHKGPVKCQEIVDALIVGGVDLGDPKKPNLYTGHVRSTIGNLKTLFHYNKRRDTVRLLRPTD